MIEHANLKRACQPANTVLTALAVAMYATQTKGRPSKLCRPNIVLQGSKASTRDARRQEYRDYNRMSVTQIYI